MGSTVPRADEDNDTIRIASERTPLLNTRDFIQTSTTSNGHIDHSDSNGHTQKPKLPEPEDGHQEPSPKPMPYTQILFLCYSSLAEPIAFFSIFPFINEMLERTGGVPETSVGFWSGLIESLFSLVQMVLMIFYGRMADRIGRKPVLVFSLTGIGVATAGFGLAGSVWQMVCLRCAAGVFAGSAVTVRTMISENSTKETQGRAFSWYMFTKNLGICLGPLVGGGLANPAEQFPRVFKGVQFFEKYPYALPTFVAGAIVLSSALTSFIFLDETLQRKTDSQSSSEPPMSTWEVIQAPGVKMVLYVFGHVTFLALAFTAVFPVFSYTSIHKGGLGFSDQWIAIFIALAGGSQAIWMLVAFPPLQKRFGTGSVLRGCALEWPFFMALYPIANEFRRQGAGWETAFWVIAPIGIFIGSAVSMAFACVQLCINDISPSPAVLGTMNALALTLNSGLRAFAPVAFTSAFAWGVKWGFADGHLIWFILVFVAVTLIPACYFLPEKAEGKLKRPQQPDEEQ